MHVRDVHDQSGDMRPYNLVRDSIGAGCDLLGVSLPRLSSMLLVYNWLRPASRERKTVILLCSLEGWEERLVCFGAAEESWKACVST